MLETTTKFTVDTGQASASLKSIREEIKEAKNAILNAAEGSKEYAEAMQLAADKTFQLREMQERIRGTANDLGEMLSNSTKILGVVASGYAAAQGAMNLFGIESESLEKQLVKVQSAMAIMNGLQGLEGLGKNIANLGTQLRAFIASSGPVGLAIAAITALGTAVYFVVDAFIDQTKAANLARIAVDGTRLSSEAAAKSYNEYYKILKKTNDELDVLQGRTTKGKLTEKQLMENLVAEILKIDKETEARLNKLKSDAAALAIKSGKTSFEISAAAVADIRAEGESLKNIIREATYAQIQLARETDKIKSTGRGSGTSAGGSGKKGKTDTKRDMTSVGMSGIPGLTEIDDFRLASDNAVTAAIIANQNAVAENQKRADEKAKQDAKDKADRVIGAARDSFTIVSNLAEVFAGKTEKQQKKAFEVQKAANIATAIIDTYRGAQSAFAQTPGGVIIKSIAAAAAVAAGLVNIKRIESTRYNGGTNAPGIGNNNPNVNLTAPQLPQANTGTANVNITGASGVEYLQKPIRAYVVESDVTAVQQKVKRIENEATF
jgi:hypothetical protein